jgi:hypothetical protein
MSHGRRVDAMADIIPEGEDLRKAVKWVSGNLTTSPDQPLQPLVKEAIFKFDLSPKDGEFLIDFFNQRKGLQ